MHMNLYNIYVVPNLCQILWYKRPRFFMSLSSKLDMAVFDAGPKKLFQITFFLSFFRGIKSN